MGFLNSSHFKKNNEKTKFLEEKVQRALRKIKNHLPENLYTKLYPTGSNRGKFYGMAKIHKLKHDEGIDKLPLQPIISNIGTPTYHTAKYLAELLRPLTTSKFTIQSSRDFVNAIKSKTVSAGYKLVSFDVKSLFTNVPLDTTIKIILKRIYKNKEIKTSIPREILKSF